MGQANGHANDIRASGGVPLRVCAQADSPYSQVVTGCGLWW